MTAKGFWAYITAILFALLVFSVVAPEKYVWLAGWQLFSLVALIAFCAWPVSSND